MADVEHTIGLLLGTEDDWPRAYEALLRRVGAVTDTQGRIHRTRSVRVTIEPFNLRDKPFIDGMRVIAPITAAVPSYDLGRGDLSAMVSRVEAAIDG